MAAGKETVLYYNPDKEKIGGMISKSAKIKGVLVRMGVRIKKIEPDQVNQKIGYLAGCSGVEEQPAKSQEELPVLPREMMVMKNFSSSRIDELLTNLRRGGVPKVELKAVVTDTNSQWTVVELYQELEREHEKMSQK